MSWLFLGIARVVDGAQGKMPKTSPLPGRWFERLTLGRARYSAGTAGAEWAWTAVVLALVVVLSLLMSTVLYLPVQDYAQYSIRGASEAGGLDYNYATSWSLHPSETLTFLFPYAFGYGKDLYHGHMPFTDYPNYLGFIVIAFAVLALFIARSRYVWFLVFVAVGTTFIAFGKFLPVLYNPMFKLMPYFSKFRVPVMILIVQQLAIVSLFGIGLDAALRVSAERGKRLAVQGLAVAFVIFLVLLLSQGVWTGEYAESIASKFQRIQDPAQQFQVARVAGSALRDDLTRRFAPMLAALFVVWFIFFRTPRMAATLAVGLTLVLGIIDFHVIDKNILHPEAWRHHDALQIIHDRSVTEQYTKSDELIDFLKSDTDHYRIFPMDSPQQPFSRLFSSNRFMIFGVSSIGGYHAAKLSWYDEFMRTVLPASLRTGRFGVLDMLNVKYIVSGAELPRIERFEPVWSGVDYVGQRRFVYRNNSVLPRAYFVDRYRIAPGRDAALRLIGSGEMDFASEVVLEAQPPVVPQSAAGATAEIVEMGFNEIRIRASTPQAALLVVSEVYYPDWKATVNGRDTEVLRANHVIRALALPAGQHDVVFRYDTSLIRKGVVVSASSMGLAIFVFAGYFVGWLRSRRRGRTDLHTNV
jgi:hypothetical protein